MRKFIQVQAIYGLVFDKCSHGREASTLLVHYRAAEQLHRRCRIHCVSWSAFGVIRTTLDLISLIRLNPLYIVECFRPFDRLRDLVYTLLFVTLYDDFSSLTAPQGERSDHACMGIAEP